MKVGIVGARGLSTIAGFRGLGVELTALCDLDAALLAEQGAKHGFKHTYRVYDDMLDSDIDAVVVATPMQLHVQQTLMALEAGKHVLCEVTAAVSMEELYWLAEAVQRSCSVYMMAENYCYIPQNQQLAAMAAAGLFDEVYYAEGEYLHDIRSLAHDDKGRTWRHYWQLGVGGCFYPTHSLGPVMKCFPNDRIATVSCMGSGHHVDQQYLQPDTSVTLCQLASGKLIRLRVDCLSPRPHNMTYYSLQGTRGAYEAPRGLGDDHKIFVDKGQPQADWQPLSDYAEYLPARYRNASESEKSAGHWGGDFFIVQDFVDAIQQGKKPYVDIKDACEWTAVALLSAQSARQGGVPLPMPRFDLPQNTYKG